jgi:hypothetical protein
VFALCVFSISQLPGLLKNKNGMLKQEFTSVYACICENRSYRTVAKRCPVETWQDPKNDTCGCSQNTAEKDFDSA